MFPKRTIYIALFLLVSIVATARSQDHARLGSEAFEQGDFSGAIEHYTEALRSKPSFALYVNLGHCHTRLKHWVAAAQAYRAAINFDGESVTAQLWRLLAQAQYNSGRFQGAMEAFFQAVSLDPDDDQDTIWIARCMMEMEQWMQAWSVLLGRLQRHPADVETLELLAYVLSRQGNWPGVMDVYRQLLIVAPDRSEYRISLANALAAQGDTGKAIDTLEFTRRVDSSVSGRINRLLADLYVAEDMPQEAAACYARLVAAPDGDSPSPDDYFRLGVTYVQISEPASAASAFKNMQETAPDDSRADLYLGHLAVQSSDVNEALLHYGAAVEKKPSGVEAYVAMADLQMKANRFKDAAALLAKAIELGDDRVIVHYNRILALMRRPDMKQAESALKIALAEHPADENILGLLDRWVEKSTALKERR